MKFWEYLVFSFIAISDCLCAFSKNSVAIIVSSAISILAIVAYFIREIYIKSKSKKIEK